MVKQINIFLDDDEHEEIKKVKGNMTWIEFLRLASELIKKNKKK